MQGKQSAIEAFLAFVDLAARVPNKTRDGSTATGKFLEFIDAARPLSVHLNRPSPTIAFEQFIVRARPLLVARVKGLISAIRERAALAARWLVRDDLLSIAGFGSAEDPYTELMAWALRPSTHPDSAWLRQHAWLKQLGLVERVSCAGACEPETQVVFEDGRPDLVMQFGGFEVVVEAKTGTAEHRTPSGEMQTHAYKRSEETAVVFITPDRREAASESAIVTTFSEFVFCLAEAVEQCPPCNETLAAFKMLFTHFLTHAPVDADMKTLVNQLNQWAEQPDWEDDDTILRRMSQLLIAMKLFGLEAQQ